VREQLPHAFGAVGALEFWIDPAAAKLAKQEVGIIVGILDDQDSR
jgi:hypothetical protein